MELQARHGRTGLILLAALTFLLAALTAGLLEAPAAKAENSTGTPCDYTTRIANMAIPQGTIGGQFGTSATSSVWVPPPNFSGGITDVNIRVEIEHPVDADLDISVTHAGKTVVLSSDNGGGGANYTGTTFDDQGANGAITAASAPFTGSFMPEQALSAFDGLPAEGVWTIRVSDDTGVLSGGPGDPPEPPQTLLSWSVDYRANSCPFEQPPCDVHGDTFNGPLAANGGVTTGAGTKGTGFVSDVDVYVHSIAGGGGTLTVSFGRVGNMRTLVTGAAPDFVETVFDDQAGQAFPFSPPNTGRFTPVESLGALAFTTGTQWRFSVARTGGTGSGTFRWGHRVMMSGDGCTDPDSDVIWTTSDNCPSIANVDQANHEFDAEGDICDADDDNDGFADTADACPRGPRSFEAGGSAPDYDADGCRDPEDADDDRDGVADTADACPQGLMGPGGDTDNDGCKDFEDADDDNDGVPDPADSCPLNADPKLTDTDRDGVGDACDPDDDGDGVIDSADAFPLDRTRSKAVVPVLSKLKVSPKTFAAAGKGASIAARRKRPAVGTTITYRVSAASTTTFTVQRVAKGVRKGKFTRADKAGKVKLKFTGRVASRGKKTKPLAKGRYVLRVQGRNANGVGKALTAKFRVVRR